MSIDKNSAQFKAFEQHLIKTIYAHVLVLSRCVEKQLNEENDEKAFQYFSTLNSFVSQSQLAYYSACPLVDNFLRELETILSKYHLTFITVADVDHFHNLQSFRNQVFDLFNSHYFLEAA
jgi:hypothetical protein